MGRVEGKVTIVTGGAVGIGWATCLLLAKEGSKVAITDILDNTGMELVSEIKSSGGVAQYWHIDVGNEKEVAQTFEYLDRFEDEFYRTLAEEMRGDQEDREG